MSYSALIFVPVCWFWWDSPPLREPDVKAEGSSIKASKAYAEADAKYYATKSIKQQCVDRDEPEYNALSFESFCSPKIIDKVEWWDCVVVATADCYKPAPPPEPEPEE